MHFREKNSPLTNVVFRYNTVPIECVSEYKYLGILLDEHMDFGKTANLLANSAGRALGAVINKIRMNKDVGFNTFTTLITVYFPFFAMGAVYGVRSIIRSVRMLFSGHVGTTVVSIGSLQSLVFKVILGG